MVDGKTRVSIFNAMMEESFRLHHRFKVPGHGSPRKISNLTWRLLVALNTVHSFPDVALYRRRARA